MLLTYLDPGRFTKCSRAAEVLARICTYDLHVNTITFPRARAREMGGAIHNSFLNNANQHTQYCSGQLLDPWRVQPCCCCGPKWMINLQSQLAYTWLRQHLPAFCSQLEHRRTSNRVLVASEGRDKTHYMAYQVDKGCCNFLKMRTKHLLGLSKLA